MEGRKKFFYSIEVLDKHYNKKGSSSGIISIEFEAVDEYLNDFAKVKKEIREQLNEVQPFPKGYIIEIISFNSI